MAKLLTSTGGKFALDKSVQAFMAFFDDGNFYVSKSHIFNTYVVAFEARLVKLNHQYVRNLVDMSVISDIYAKDISSLEVVVQSSSQMQREAIELFKKAVLFRSSDIHIRVTSTKTVILFRVHNDLEFIKEETGIYGTQMCSTIYQAMTDISDPTFQINTRQDARISDKSKLPVLLDGIRVATTPQVDGNVMVLRLLYNDTSTSNSLSDLGFLDRQCEVIDLLTKLPTGINIIAGPTGSGKSTTLQRALGKIIFDTDGKKNIITVEDPPEYPIPGAVQTPVGYGETAEDQAREFQDAIKSGLRLDPDIFMIGEMRDPPSTKLAIQAAMTGHQVWSTVHANSAFGIFDRLIDLGIPSSLAFDHTVVSGVMCQRLVKLLCNNCKVPLSKVASRYKPPELERISYVALINYIFVQGEGCSCCRNTGTVGRIAVGEVVKTDAKLMDLLKTNDKAGALNYWKESLGGTSIVESVLIRIASGVIDPFMAEMVVGPLVGPLVGLLVVD